MAPRQKAQARKGVKGTGGKNSGTDVNEILPWKCRAWKKQVTCWVWQCQNSRFFKGMLMHMIE